MNINNYITSGIIEMYVMGLCAPQEKAELEVLRLAHPAIKSARVRFEMELETNLLKSPQLCPLLQMRRF